MSNVLIIPGNPSQWSRCRWLMKIASRSGSPMLLRSWCWVPSPQSNRIRSPPARNRIAGSPRLGVGTLPAVPAKKSERSMRPARLASGDPMDLETRVFEPLVALLVLLASGRPVVAGAVDFDHALLIRPMEIDLELGVDAHELPLLRRQGGEVVVLLRAARPRGAAQVQLDRLPHLLNPAT